MSHSVASYSYIAKDMQVSNIVKVFHCQTFNLYVFLVQYRPMELHYVYFIQIEIEVCSINMAWNSMLLTPM